MWKNNTIGAKKVNTNNMKSRRQFANDTRSLV